MEVVRLSRLRRNEAVRNWISQSVLRAKDIILPFFVVDGKGRKEEISSMPGVHHLSVDNLLKEVSGLNGTRAVLLFGVTKVKDNSGKEAFKKDGAVQRAVRALKNRFPELIVITDVCLCGYVPHGHCGIVKSKKINNTETLKALSKIALSHAEAGADFVAPSAMADGQVGAIREILDGNGFGKVGILAYAAKYASNFYGPFRGALNSNPRFGDRKSYQMDFRNSDEALREIQKDVEEGADIVMVKPALAYLDIIYRAKQKFNVPIAAYNVSGEYSAVKKLSEGDKMREKELALEVLTSIKRAGADFIISYFGKEVEQWLKQD